MSEDPLLLQRTWISELHNHLPAVRLTISEWRGCRQKLPKLKTLARYQQMVFASSRQREYWLVPATRSARHVAIKGEINWGDDLLSRAVAGLGSPVVNTVIVSLRFTGFSTASYCVLACTTTAPWGSFDVFLAVA